MSFHGYLRQSTTVTISVGPLVDSGDGNTEETGQTVQDTDFYLSKNGAAKANPSDTNDASEDANGIYRKQLDTTDTGTLGLLTVYLHHSSGLYLRQDYQVVTANWYDTMCSTDQLDVNTTAVGGTSQTANDMSGDIDTILSRVTAAVALASVCTETRLAELDSGNIPTDLSTIDTVVDGIQTDLDNATDGLGALKALIDTLDGVADAIKAVTDNLPNSGALTDIDTGVNNIEAKLPTNYIMGSSVVTDKDDEIDAIKAVTDNLPNSGALTDIDTGVNNIEGKLPSKSYLMGSADSDGGFDTEAKADVNAEVLDVLNVDTFAEPGQGLPPATATLVQKINYLYKQWRNKKDATSTLRRLYNDDGTTVGQKNTLSESGGTVTVAEVESGP